jgi:hypothetical protein
VFKGEVFDREEAEAEVVAAVAEAPEKEADRPQEIPAVTEPAAS